MIPADSRLPGIAARLAAYVPRLEEDRHRLRAAVALILVPDPDALLLIRRAERAGDPWSGHMALPGGRQAPADPTLQHTAIRESAEEVGLTLLAEQCIGVLDDVAPRTPVLPPIAVRPFVFALSSRPTLIQNAEVASMYWVEIADLVRPDARRETEVSIQGRPCWAAAYYIADDIVWGMTERILTTLMPHL